jgi:MYXO-CTERM domain-containing protein
VACLTDATCTGGKVCEITTNTCVECTQTSLDACTSSGRGASCLANGSCGCLANADCGGRVCDTAKHVCTATLAPTPTQPGTDAGAGTPVSPDPLEAADGGSNNPNAPVTVEPTEPEPSLEEPPSGSSAREGVTPTPVVKKKKKNGTMPDQTGCSAAPGSSAPSDMATWALAVAGVAFAGSRRRRARG